ncbi:unnamed protein product [Cladocopium goreaui]|uniref:Uncharacterized protein n=1 Tax=Cladocopium goreaui TaxID=2562237 RepID=A0A9P1DTF8_9DINO|nr:unnamed protein product [Cladocopium goreaui]
MKLTSLGVYDHLMPFVHRHIRDGILNGERLNDGTLSSGEQQLTVLVDVQVGDILAFSLLEGSESSPANVAWELSEPDGVVIYSAEYASIAGVKFPLLENFVVAGPAACIQNQASDLELYSSDIDFSSLYPKHLGILLRSGNLRYQEPQKNGIRIGSD